MIRARRGATAPPEHGRVAKGFLAQRRNVVRLVAVGLVVVALFAVGRLVDARDIIETIRAWIDGWGPWGPVLYVLLFVAATLVALPGTPFTVLAALLFGEVQGFLVMVVATTLSASAGFLIARYLMRERLERWLSGHTAYERFTEMMKRDHWIVIPFMRLMPFFPFTFNNYALGLTRLSFWRYLLWSELVMVPMNAVLVLLAASLYRAAFRGEVAWPVIGGAIAAGVVVAVIGLLIRRRLG